MPCKIHVCDNIQLFRSDELINITILWFEIIDFTQAQATTNSLYIRKVHLAPPPPQKEPPSPLTFQPGCGPDNISAIY